MFNIGFQEMVLLGLLALIFIGPKELPELARTLGRFMNDLKRATGDLSSSFKEDFMLDKLNPNAIRERMNDMVMGTDKPKENQTAVEPNDVPPEEGTPLPMGEEQSNLSYSEPLDDSAAVHAAMEAEEKSKKEKS
jgi:sec-independent protein translocase protein TatB